MWGRGATARNPISLKRRSNADQSSRPNKGSVQLLILLNMLGCSHRIQSYDTDKILFSFSGLILYFEVYGPVKKQIKMSFYEISGQQLFVFVYTSKSLPTL